MLSACKIKVSANVPCPGSIGDQPPFLEEYLMSHFRFATLVFLFLAAVAVSSLIPTRKASMQGRPEQSAAAAATPDIGIGASLNGARPFPANNPWNMDISRFPVHPNSLNLLTSIGLNTGLHPDFGTFWQGAPIGIPYVVVAGSQAKVPMNFTSWPGESDPGPYPFPPNAPVEGGAAASGDRHVLTVDRDGWKLYETYSSYPINSGASWDAANGAVWNLSSNKLRTTGWTSADAAGLPIFPGLVRRDEVVQIAEIKHALRFTAQTTRTSYVYPATHQAGSTSNVNAPPMGLRLRLKASFNINDSRFSPNVRVILRALQKYGLILADNGSNWYISGTHDPLWDDDELSKLSIVKGGDFEVVQTPGHLLMPANDYDGDGRTDVSVLRPSNNTWYVSGSISGFSATQFGTAGDVMTPADFTGDGKSDIAVFRPSTGTWYVMRSEDNIFYGTVFGTNGDIPTPADYDGDGKADLAVYRPSTGTWYMQRSTAGFSAVQFGIAEDKPAVGDFDGDGKADIAVYRPSTGYWYRLNSSNGSFTAVQFGTAGDKIVPADYTGDGKTDIAVWRPSTGTWYVLRSEDSTFYGAGFGLAADVPVPGDYDGDSKSDLAVFRPSTGTWYFMQSFSGFSAIPFGIAEDVPAPNAFVY